ncbi:MAG: sigma-70 family RNA polymerase sigma factor [Gemmataceae bacterium]
MLQSLLDRLRAGDPTARNELIGYSRERFRLLTRQMLRRFPGVRQWEDTSDVVQNVLVRLDRVLQNLPVASPRDFLALATVQIRRELIDLTRHHFGPQGLGANTLPPGREHRDASPPEPSDSSADPYRLGQWHDLHSEIAALDEKHRVLFDLLYYQGLTQSEAAALLEEPLRSFRRRWQAARLLLMSRLGGALPF